MLCGGCWRFLSCRSYWLVKASEVIAAILILSFSVALRSSYRLIEISKVAKVIIT